MDGDLARLDSEARMVGSVLPLQPGPLRSQRRCDALLVSDGFRSFTHPVDGGHVPC
jgi:hypothetical protein